MEAKSNIQAINVRYSRLAGESCCLSCGSALSFAKPQEGEVCVDIGSGRGFDVLRMADAAGAEGHAYGIDISGGMIDKARSQAEKLGIENATFIQAELDNIPLDDNSADVLISNCTINHADDKQAVWNEVYRVLKPGGRFVVSDIYSVNPVPEEYARDPEAVAECWAGADTKERYMHRLAAAGFRDITVHEESAPYTKGTIEVVSFTLSSVKNE